MSTFQNRLYRARAGLACLPLFLMGCSLDLEQLVEAALEAAGEGGYEHGEGAGGAGQAGGGPLDPSPPVGPPRPPIRPPSPPVEPSDGKSKLDLLFMVDNSISMSDKQALLASAIPELVRRLTNPGCVDAAGRQGGAPSSEGTCPEGQRLELTPLTDVHIGVVSSSLGDAGANVACPAEGFPRYVPERIDLAHLMGSLERGQGTANTPEGFLEWRAGATDLDGFNRSFQDMLQAVGENGCGWEASLESWYRFLVDPYPYRGLARVQCPGSASTGLNCVQPATDAGNRILLDETLLAQRAAFLRPDSVVAVLMLSDENDCSLQVGNQSWVVAAIDDSRPMFRGSSTCAADANDKCCYSCPLGPPDGCAADPICNADPESDVLANRLPASEDGTNLRCYQQKRRFGVDFLYPTERYVNALSQLDLCWNAPGLSLEGCAPEDVVQNPLYEGERSPERVFLGGIVGVPWQAIASDVDAEGRALGPNQLRFQDAEELERNGTWDEIVGSPGVRWRAASGDLPEQLSVPAVPPSLPQMVESEFPRAGVTPGNPINGREYDTAFDLVTPDDLQYACIFPLPAPQDCTLRDPTLGEPCDCYPGNSDRPLCEQSPGASAPGNVQYWGKAYPGARQLEVLRAYGSNSVVASICARNVTDPASPDYGYRPALAALLERIGPQLASEAAE